SGPAEPVRIADPADEGVPDQAHAQIRDHGPILASRPRPPPRRIGPAGSPGPPGRPRGPRAPLGSQAVDRDGTVLPGGTAHPAPAWFVGLFAHRRWIRRTEPFPHVYAREVFTEEFSGRLRAEVARVRTTGGTGDTASPGATAGREHTAISLWELRDGPLALFTSREWHDLIAGLAEAVLPGGGAGAVTGTLRHHPVGGQAGETRHEPTGAAGALALLFHLGPAEWRAGDGGETALYPVAGDAA